MSPSPPLPAPPHPRPRHRPSLDRVCFRRDTHGHLCKPPLRLRADACPRPARPPRIPPFRRRSSRKYRTSQSPHLRSRKLWKDHHRKDPDKLRRPCRPKLVPAPRQPRPCPGLSPCHPPPHIPLTSPQGAWSIPGTISAAVVRSPIGTASPANPLGSAATSAPTALASNALIPLTYWYGNPDTKSNPQLLDRLIRNLGINVVERHDADPQGIHLPFLP